MNTIEQVFKKSLPTSLLKREEKCNGVVPHFIKGGFGGIFFLLLLFVCFPVSADFTPSQWQVKADITGGGNKSGFVALELPPEFFSHLQADLSDLRVVNGHGEVPYALGVEKGESSFGSIPGHLLDLSSVAGNSTSFVLDLGKSGNFHNAVTIQTDSVNFRRNVKIEGSNDRISWRMLNPNGQIFDVTLNSRPVQVHDTRVEYPDATFRYLRVEIFDNGEGPLHVTGGSVYQYRTRDAHEITYTVTPEIAENTKDRSTDVVLDLGVSGIPHTKGSIFTSHMNFDRSIVISESDTKTDWQLLAHQYIFSIDTPQFKGSQLAFTYPESHKRYLKLSVVNNDDRPLAITGVTLSGTVRNIVFQYDPSEQYTVYMGNSEARRPKYDIERIRQYLDAYTLDRVGAGGVVQNADYQPVQVPKPPISERYPWLLSTALGIIVAILAFLLLRIATAARNSPPPTS